MPKVAEPRLAQVMEVVATFRLKLGTPGEKVTTVLAVVLQELL